MTFRTTAHAALGGLIIATTAVLLAQPAAAQTTMCKNGLPDWAAKAYSGRHQSGFLCEPVARRTVKHKPVVVHADPQPRVIVRPATTAKVQRPTTSARTSNETATVDADATSAKTTVTASTLNCRIYLPSTGQTVDAPCAR